jgi:hypothetical protein
MDADLGVPFKIEGSSPLSPSLIAIIKPHLIIPISNPQLIMALTNPELVLMNNIWDPDLQNVINDIVHCNYARLKDSFTKDHAKQMEELLGPVHLPLPPPQEPSLQRQRRHYRKEEVLNKMCELMDAYPVLRSTNIERVITKFHLANQIPLGGPPLL